MESCTLCNALLSLLSILVIFLILKFNQVILVTIVTFPSIYKMAKRGIMLALLMFKIRWKNLTVIDLMEQRVREHPNKVMFYFNDDTWTFQEVNELCNQIGNYFQSQGYRKGDVVSLMMENCPENVCIWIGLAKIGVITSIINTNLRSENLRATLNVNNSKATIFDENCVEAMEGMLSSGEWSQKLLSWGPCSVGGSMNLKEKLEKVSRKTPKPDEPINMDDEVFYMYTSGSTGLPKAVAYKHSRFQLTGATLCIMWGVGKEDIMYTVLPLYHASAGVTGVGACLTKGTSMVIRKKFSASRFWKDCIDYNVTVVQFIGEICRYLLRQPIRPEETQHKIRAFLGSGLRGEIWNDFITRFKIAVVGELYGATESNCGLVNVDGEVGTIGFLPRIIYHMYPAGLIKVDDETGEPIRDPKTGLGIRSDIDEPGEWVGKIMKGHPINDFGGYKNAESGNKILKNIFQAGDSVYRSNDIMTRDKYGHFRFRDRAATNYRWKGENISSVEVENTVSRLIDLKDCAAYGVKIPGTDGNPGMIAIADPDAAIDLVQLVADMRKHLASYAIPLFLRRSTNIETTGTYKTIKKVLEAEGFNINKTKDKLYFLQGGKYVEIDQVLYEQIMSEQITP